MLRPLEAVETSRMRPPEDRVRWTDNGEADTDLAAKSTGSEAARIALFTSLEANNRLRPVR